MNSSNSTKLRILGICGSLRKNSYNLGLLRSVEQTLPNEAEFVLADISQLPFFREELENPFPEPVKKLIELAASADAVMISTPEYNISITAVLKNALEWLSRRTAGLPLADKPVAIMGATPLATIGTSQAQAHLRDILFGLNMHLLNRPIVMIGNARDKFDNNGNLTDTATIQLLKQQSEELIKWTIRIKQHEPD